MYVRFLLILMCCDIIIIVLMVNIGPRVQNSGIIWKPLNLSPDRNTDFYVSSNCFEDHYKWRLKEKLPQAFMQIGWMEDDFRNLTAKV